MVCTCDLVVTSSFEIEEASLIEKSAPFPECLREVGQAHEMMVGGRAACKLALLGVRQ